MSSLAWLIDLGPSSVLLQAAQALITAAIFGLFQRWYASPALGPWTLAWLALFAHLAGLGAMETASSALPATSGPMTALAALTLLAGYLMLGWLLLGTYAISTGRPPPRTAERGALGIAIALAALTTLPAAFDPAGQLTRYVVRAGIFGVLGGIARLLAGVALLRRWRPFAVPAPPGSRMVERVELGRLLVAFALIAIGALSLGSFALTLGVALAYPETSTAEFVPIVPNAGGLYLLLNVELGLGLVIWLLEGEQRRAEHRAYHDPLTGLPNRQLLLDRLRHQIAASRRTNQPFAVLFIDVDRFKAINDAHGHPAGDRLLQAIAGRLTSALREVDTVARLGGDEFVVLATDIRHASDVVAVADKLRHAMEGPISIEGSDVRVTLSLGASIYPDDGGDADTLLRVSDGALYRAKEEGRDRVRLAQV